MSSPVKNKLTFDELQRLEDNLNNKKYFTHFYDEDRRMFVFHFKDLHRRDFLYMFTKLLPFVYYQYSRKGQGRITTLFVRWQDERTKFFDRSRKKEKEKASNYQRQYFKSVFTGIRIPREKSHKFISTYQKALLDLLECEERDLTPVIYYITPFLTFEIPDTEFFDFDNDAFVEYNSMFYGELKDLTDAYPCFPFFDSYNFEPFDYPLHKSVDFRECCYLRFLNKRNKKFNTFLKTNETNFHDFDMRGVEDFFAFAASNVFGRRRPSGEITQLELEEAEAEFNIMRDGFLSYFPTHRYYRITYSEKGIEKIEQAYKEKEPTAGTFTFYNEDWFMGYFHEEDCAELCNQMHLYFQSGDYIISYTNKGIFKIELISDIVCHNDCHICEEFSSINNCSDCAYYSSD